MILRRREINLLLLILVFIISGCQKYEEEYHPNGQLRFKIPLEDGVRQGKALYYSDAGALTSYAYWKNGRLDGENAFLFPNGRPQQLSYFKNGVRCCRSSFYSEEGALLETQDFDERGRMIDYAKFRSDGARNFSEQTRKPILLSDDDTVSAGDFFELEIRLGNRRYDNIEVIVGSSNYDEIADAPRLPKKNQTTSIVKIRAEKEGINKIEGFILEMNSIRPDTVLTVPFKYEFYVKSRDSISL